MITLYQFPPAFGIANMSPFCLHVETYLRMAELPYESVYTMDLKKAPKGKLPYIDDEGTIVPDSRFIIRYLKQQYGDPFDKALSPKQSAISTAFKTMLDEHTYWLGVYYRWVYPPAWAIIKQIYFKQAPRLLRGIVSHKVQKYMIDRLKKQGIGLHNHDEIYILCCEDVIALTDFLADKKYMFGNTISSLDACVYSFLISMIAPDIPTPFKEFILQQDNLVAYCQRIHEQYYPDMPFQFKQTTPTELTPTTLRPSSRTQ